MVPALDAYISGHRVLQSALHAIASPFSNKLRGSKGLSVKGQRPSSSFGANRVAWARHDRNFRRTRNVPFSSHLTHHRLPHFEYLHSMHLYVSATYFCRERERRGSSLANFSSSLSPPREPPGAYVLPSYPPQFLLAPSSYPGDSNLYPRGGQPLLFIPHPLFFILYIPRGPRVRI